MKQILIRIFVTEQTSKKQINAKQKVKLEFVNAIFIETELRAVESKAKSTKNNITNQL